jgi:hypothetical protein
MVSLRARQDSITPASRSCSISSAGGFQFETGAASPWVRPNSQRGAVMAACRSLPKAAAEPAAWVCVSFAAHGAWQGGGRRQANASAGLRGMEDHGPVPVLQRIWIEGRCPYARCGRQHHTGPAGSIDTG